MVLRWWGMLLRVILVSNLAEVSRKEAKEQRRKARKLSFPVSAGNVILEVLPPGIIEAEPLNYIPTQSMGTRCLNKCVQLAQTARFPQIINSLACISKFSMVQFRWNK